MKVQKSTIDSNYKLVTYDNGVEYIVYHSASWLVGATHDEIGTKLKKNLFPSENGGYIAETKISNEIGLSEGEEVTIKGKNWDRSWPAFIRRCYKNGNVTVFISSTRETVKLTPKNFDDFEITAIRWFANTKEEAELTA